MPGDPPAVFLAGGITHVEDWQQHAASSLRDLDVFVLNPRRRQFLIEDPDQAAIQIRWEHHHLHLPGVLTLFWFPESDPALTVQPIALLELGAALDNPARQLVVGADPVYPRARDVEWQTRLARPELTVHRTLEATLEAARSSLSRGR